MGWYDDEDVSRLPDWAVAPMMWLLCLAAALMPSLVLVALCQWLAPAAPPYVPFLAYGVGFAAMVAAVRPWTAW
ncbi:hypothetical protein DMC25_00250 [Caulobacter sp. D4A]|uniref:hypothetical protein n=1 Tax=unclassified Caulobacter TaxID=2648921 RepID=UPI000D7292B8|nr:MULTISPECIES: hypothetical protein [unclassified Caulobacter]PXA95110.1 hypothetical protein DMC18_04765 [Caulobacter sp. D5]PXA95702.1 hypothetical protein DMC25_00250 [Caulobacter sp. D4A]